MPRTGPRCGEIGVFICQLVIRVGVYVIICVIMTTKFAKLHSEDYIAIFLDVNNYVQIYLYRRQYIKSFASIKQATHHHVHQNVPVQFPYDNPITVCTHCVVTLISMVFLDGTLFPSLGCFSTQTCKDLLNQQFGIKAVHWSNSNKDST